jgi:signal transduction histidine kinase
MRISIRLRTILALNVYVVGLALVMGWIAQDTAGTLVEERYVKEMVASAAGFLKDKRFPRTDAMMGYLRELFNAEWVASAADGSAAAASSLPAAATGEFQRRLGDLGTSGVVRLGTARYRFDSADVGAPQADAARRTGGRLYMLVPDAQFQQARRSAQARVASVILPAALTATVLAVLFSLSITRPIRKLAGEMDRLSDAEGYAAAARPEAVVRRGPKEIRRLAGSFDRLLARLGEARRRAVQSEQLAVLGRVALSVAHELRNPLSGIKMNVRVLKDREGLTDDAGVAAILREIDRMGLYLDELMSLSPGARPADRALSPSATRLSELADGVLVILGGRLRHAGIAVKTDVPPDEPTVLADANQIRQAMMNLLVNAIEASPAGETISLAVRRAGEHLRFSVSDTGRGVPADGGDVFAAFATGKPNGVGLGLYICKRIIARHGGRIGYDSSDAGATFWFELPAGAAAADADPAADQGPGGDGA